MFVRHPHASGPSDARLAVLLAEAADERPAYAHVRRHAVRCLSTYLLTADAEGRQAAFAAVAQRYSAIAREYKSRLAAAAPADSPRARLRAMRDEPLMRTLAKAWQDMCAGLPSTAKAALPLHGQCLDLLDLAACDWSGWSLRGASMHRADLSRTDLSGCDLSGCDLSDADLSGARLARAKLCGANLSGTYAAWADFSGSDLSGAIITDVDLGASVLAAATLRGALLSGSRLAGASLSGADLSGANLFAVNLTGSKLYGSRLTHTGVTRDRLYAAGMNAYSDDATQWGRDSDCGGRNPLHGNYYQEAGGNACALPATG